MRLGHGRSSKRPRRGGEETWGVGSGARRFRPGRCVSVRREQLGKEKELTGRPRLSAGEREGEGMLAG